MLLVQGHVVCRIFTLTGPLQNYCQTLKLILVARRRKTLSKITWMSESKCDRERQNGHWRLSVSRGYSVSVRYLLKHFKKTFECNRSTVWMVCITVLKKISICSKDCDICLNSLTVCSNGFCFRPETENACLKNCDISGQTITLNWRHSCLTLSYPFDVSSKGAINLTINFPHQILITYFQFGPVYLLQSLLWN